MSGTLDRWYVSGALGVGTAFDEPTDAHSALSVSWTGVGSAIRHGSSDALNLLDARPAAVNQGPNLSWWGLNAGGKATRLGLITSRFTATSDGGVSSYMAFHTKGPGGDVAEALRITGTGNVGIGTTDPVTLLHLNKDGTAGPTLLLTNPRATSKNSVIYLGSGPPGVGKHFFISNDWTGSNTDKLSVGYNNAGAWTEHLALTTAGNVGIGTNAPEARLQIGGDLALQSTSGAKRALPAGATLIWSDGNWLRLNQNLDYTKPIFGVHTPGVLAPGSLNVGGVGGFGDPGGGNVWIAGDIQVAGRIGAGGQPPAPRTTGWGGGIHTWDLEVEGSAWCYHNLYVDGELHWGNSWLSHDQYGSSIKANGQLSATAPKVRVQGVFVVEGPLDDGTARSLLGGMPIYSVIMGVENNAQGQALLWYWKDGRGANHKHYEFGGGFS